MLVTAGICGCGNVFTWCGEVHLVAEVALWLTTSMSVCRNSDTIVETCGGEHAWARRLVARISASSDAEHAEVVAVVEGRLKVG